MVIEGVYVETFEEDALYGCLNFLCIQFRYTTGWTDCALLVGLSIAWGVGDATFQTQIGALLGILYPHDTEAAFAQLKIWESAGTSVAFFVSSHMDLAAKQFSLLSILVVSTAALLVVVLRPERANSLKA
jgi:hypothetical protein